MSTKTNKKKTVENSSKHIKLTLQLPKYKVLKYAQTEQQENERNKFYFKVKERAYNFILLSTLDSRTHMLSQILLLGWQSVKHGYSLNSALLSHFCTSQQDRDPQWKGNEASFPK